MALARNIMGGGFSAGQAVAINGNIASAVSAAGTTQGTATALRADVNFLTTVAASSGAILASCQPGDSQIVYNAGANTLTVYPDSGSRINGGSTNVGVSLATNTACVYIRVTTTRWIGIMSA